MYVCCYEKDEYRKNIKKCRVLEKKLGVNIFMHYRAVECEEECILPIEGCGVNIFTNRYYVDDNQISM